MFKLDQREIAKLAKAETALLAALNAYVAALGSTKDANVRAGSASLISQALTQGTGRVAEAAK
jgi:hypothetical protein